MTQLSWFLQCTSTAKLQKGFNEGSTHDVPWMHNLQRETTITFLIYECIHILSPRKQFIGTNNTSNDLRNEKPRCIKITLHNQWTSMLNNLQCSALMWHCQDCTVFNTDVMLTWENCSEFTQCGSFKSYTNQNCYYGNRDKFQTM